MGGVLYDSDDQGMGSPMQQFRNGRFASSFCECGQDWSKKGIPQPFHISQKNRESFKYAKAVKVLPFSRLGPMFKSEELGKRDRSINNEEICVDWSESKTPTALRDTIFSEDLSCHLDWSRDGVDSTFDVMKRTEPGEPWATGIDWTEKGEVPIMKKLNHVRNSEMSHYPVRNSKFGTQPNWNDNGLPLGKKFTNDTYKIDWSAPGMPEHFQRIAHFPLRSRSMSLVSEDLFPTGSRENLKEHREMKHEFGKGLTCSSPMMKGMKKHCEKLRKKTRKFGLFICYGIFGSKYGNPFDRYFCWCDDKIRIS